MWVERGNATRQTKAPAMDDTQSTADGHIIGNKCFTMADSAEQMQSDQQTAIMHSTRLVVQFVDS